LPESARPYLPTNDRRRQLLDAAAAVFAREGYAGMTMASLADEAHVSRRLVYNHFPNLATLYEEFFIDRASRYLDGITQLNEGTTEVVVAFEQTFRFLLEMPPGDFRALRLVFTDTGLSALDSARETFRSHIESRWLPLVTGVGFDEETARARIWSMVGALFALSELVTRGEASIECAAQTATGLVVSMRANLPPP
jgi:AcrR family transcriptional regulator